MPGVVCFRMLGEIVNVDHLPEGQGRAHFEERGLAFHEVRGEPGVNNVRRFKLGFARGREKGKIVQSPRGPHRPTPLVRSLLLLYLLLYLLLCLLLYLLLCLLLYLLLYLLLIWLIASPLIIHMDALFILRVGAQPLLQILWLRRGEHSGPIRQSRGPFFLGPRGRNRRSLRGVGELRGEIVKRIKRVRGVVMVRVLAPREKGTRHEPVL